MALDPSTLMVDIKYSDRNNIYWHCLFKVAQQFGTAYNNKQLINNWKLSRYVDSDKRESKFTKLTQTQLS